jgi:hypothetical protein
MVAAAAVGPAFDVTALEIAISAAAVFAPKGPDWDRLDTAELEVFFKIGTERFALELISRTSAA